MRLRLPTLAAALAFAVVTLVGCGGASDSPEAAPDSPEAAVKAYFANIDPTIRIGEVSYDPNRNRALVTRLGSKWGAWSAVANCTGGDDSTNPHYGQPRRNDHSDVASQPMDFDQAYSEAAPGRSYSNTAIPLDHYSGKWTVFCAR